MDCYLLFVIGMLFLVAIFSGSLIGLPLLAQQGFEAFLLGLEFFRQHQADEFGQAVLGDEFADEGNVFQIARAHQFQAFQLRHLLQAV